MNAEEYRAAANYWKTKERAEMPADQLKAAVEEFFDANHV